MASSGPGSREVCRRCSRTVQMVSVGGVMIAVDQEVIAVVPSGSCGENVAVKSAVTGRRIHAELCEGYQIAERRARTQRELAAYNRQERKKRPKGVL